MIDTTKLLVIDSIPGKSKVYYDPETGLFYREYQGRIKRANESNGTYLYVSVNKRFYPAGRLAWFMFYGKWPEQVIDHINGDPTDNRIVNLHDVSQSANCRNRKDFPSPDISYEELLTSFTIRKGRSV